MKSFFLLLIFLILNLPLVQAQDNGFANSGDVAEFTGEKNAQSAQLELSFSCKNLPKMDALSGSDPYCKIYLKDPKTGFWREKGRTETVINNQDPNFQKSFLTTWTFEEPTHFHLELWDEDGDGKADFLGVVELEDSEIASAPNMTVTKQLKINDKVSGEITIRGKEFRNPAHSTLTLECSANGIPKMQGLFTGDANPYLEFRRKDNGSVIKATREVMNTKNPNWGKVTLDLRRLCDGDYQKAFSVDVKHYDEDGKHQLVGTLDVTADELMKGIVDKDIELTEKLQKKHSRDQKQRFVVFRDPVLEKHFSFLNFLQGGCELGLCVGIDFTGSNGDPRDKDSLHYSSLDLTKMTPDEIDKQLHEMGFNKLSHYEKAVWALGQFLRYYDHDQNYPTDGFGAKFRGEPRDQDAHHCFSLSQFLGQEEPFIKGVDNLIPAIQKVKKNVILSGPTYFSEIIKKAREEAAHLELGQGYNVQLIITDGKINDLQQTMREVILAQDTPLAIIIVGVGNADFSSMEALDGDEKHPNNVIRQMAKKMKEDGEIHHDFQDIVQFVELNKFFPPGKVYKDQVQLEADQTKFTKEIMAELPEQVVSYMKRKHYQPTKK